MIKKEQKDRLFESLKAGLNVKDSCALADISKAIYYVWIKEDPKFKKDVKKARLTLKRAIISLILNAAKTDWRAGMTYLERVWPKEFHLDTRAEKEMSTRLDEIEVKLDKYLDAKTQKEKTNGNYATA